MKHKDVKQFVINVPFPVIMINCKKCKANFSLIAYAGDAWLHQKASPDSPIYCPYCTKEIYE